MLFKLYKIKSLTELIFIIKHNNCGTMRCSEGNMLISNLHYFKKSWVDYVMYPTQYSKINPKENFSAARTRLLWEYRWNLVVYIETKWLIFYFLSDLYMLFFPYCLIH